MKYGQEHTYRDNYDSENMPNDDESLYSVKWYKDNDEFYRYMPKMKPAIQSFKMDGVRVEVCWIM